MECVKVSELTNNQSEFAENKKVPPQMTEGFGISPCCRDTVKQHVTFNLMMVCPSCKSLIKCFDDQKAFKNYITFCQSRRREVLVDEYQKYFVVSFKSYD